MKKLPNWLILILSGIPSVIVFFWAWNGVEKFVREHRADPVAVGLIFGVASGITAWYFIYQYICEKVEERHREHNKGKNPAE